MRELKFRAWDKEDKKYYPLINLWFDSPVGELGSAELEQYTGLKDKNGKEIYEGDIVRAKSCGEIDFKAGAIEMVQQMFLIMNAAHYSSPDITHTEPLGHYCDHELEILGNIHENPELLGDTNVTNKETV